MKMKKQQRYYMQKLEYEIDSWDKRRFKYD